MHRISSRYRAPKGRPSKRRKAQTENSRKRFATPANKPAAVLEPPHSSANLSAVSVPSCNTNTVAKSYVLFDTEQLSDLLEGIPCGECSKPTLTVKYGSSFGYANKIHIECSCGFTSSTFSSCRIPDKRIFDINKRLVEAFLSIGRGHAAMERFSSILGMHVMNKKTFANCLMELADEGKYFREEMLTLSRTAVRDAHNETHPENAAESVIAIGVSYDGTWHKRGHTSLYGIGLVIDTLTGLVVDFEILSKFCGLCNSGAQDLRPGTAEHHIWHTGHIESGMCQKNFTGSSGAMEVHAAEILWRRSEDIGFQYTTVVSDGDAKTYLHLKKLKVYGPNVDIVKEECLNHVAKRVVTGLNGKITEWRLKRVTLGGKKRGSLKKETVIKLSNFYRKAIKENAPNVANMKNAVFATLHHCMSTDSKPQHSKCPKSQDSWCFYNRAVAKGQTPESHATMKTCLSEDVVGKILPVYQRLASDEILSRCTSAMTQNANESMHSMIWRMCPKETFISKKRLEVAVFSAVGENNLGVLATSRLKAGVRNEDINDTTAELSARRDSRRIVQSQQRSEISYKKARVSSKIRKACDQQKQKSSEGPMYSAGKF